MTVRMESLETLRKRQLRRLEETGSPFPDRWAAEAA